METQVKEQVRRFVEEKLVNAFEFDKEFIPTITKEKFMEKRGGDKEITERFGAEYVEYARKIFLSK